jgi:predicted metal-dependent phosphoesterase TrpH
MPGPRIDLHLHSTESDGDLRPAAIARLLVAKGIQYAALTDHDTVAGVPEFLAEASNLGLKAVPGVEFSADSQRILHILGLGFDPTSPALATFNLDMIARRRRRNEEMAELLRGLGVQITVEEVEAVAGGQIAARPHFALVLMRKKYAANLQDAFQRYIGDHAPAFVRRGRPPVGDIINIIKGAGGVAIVAHPVLMASGWDMLVYELDKLIELGLDGLEAAHCDIANGTHRKLLDLAKSRKLLVSVGSDFHGDIKPQVKVGRGYHHKVLPLEPAIPLLERLGMR